MKSDPIPYIDKIFILHCKLGYEARAEFQRRQFAREQIPFEFFVEGDVADMTPEIMKKYFSVSMSPVAHSCAYKHFLVWKKIAEGGYSRCVVFEDDTILQPGARAELEAIVRETRELSSDVVVYLSNAGNKYTPRSRLRPGKRLYLSDHSRAADAYLLGAEVARKRVGWIEQHRIEMPIDHQVNRIDPELSIKMYWAEDPISENGSMTGAFSSSFENRYSLEQRRWRWQLDKFYKMHVLRNLR